MAQIDVQLDARFQDFLKAPVCVPLPQPGSVTVTLPSGATLKGIGDLTKGIPTDCSLGFSLLLQLGPLLGNFECVVKILKLIKPLIDIVKGLPFPPVKAIEDFAKAAVDVGECIVAFTPAGGLPIFIRDILCLVIKILSCLTEELESIAKLMTGLAIDIQTAEADGNEELLAALRCAQENAATAAEASTKAIEPVMVILDLAGPLMEMLGVGPFEKPTIGAAGSAEQIETLVTTLKGIVDALKTGADIVGGC